MQTSKESRRDFLRRAAAFGLVGVGATTIAGCGGGGEGGSGGGSGAGEGSAAPTTACGDVSALNESELQLRNQMAQSLQYVEESNVDGQLCSNCQLYVAPAAGDACGGCTLFPGPVAPGGYCTSWVAAAAG